MTQAHGGLTSTPERPDGAPPREGATLRVHVLCAPPYGRNPGMSTVDLGLVRLLTELGGGVDLRCWRLWDDSEWRKPARRTQTVGPGLVHDLDSGLDYHLVGGREEELADADLLLYWGDFHHLATYQRSTVDVLTHELARPLAARDAAEQARRVLLQEGAGADVRSRTMSYGTTLGLNQPRDYAGAYQDLLQQFVRGARRVWFRDPYSASVAALLRQDDASCHGVDAAVLAGVLPATPGIGTMEVFLGRSRLVPEEIALFGRALARATDTRPRWLGWGKEPAFRPMGMRPRFRRAWRDAALRTDQEIPLGELLDRVQHASLVLTDTYPTWPSTPGGWEHRRSCSSTILRAPRTSTEDRRTATGTSGATCTPSGKPCHCWSTSLPCEVDTGPRSTVSPNTCGPRSCSTQRGDGCERWRTGHSPCCGRSSPPRGGRQSAVARQRAGGPVPCRRHDDGARTASVRCPGPGLRRDPDEGRKDAWRGTSQHAPAGGFGGWRLAPCDTMAHSHR